MVEIPESLVFAIAAPAWLIYRVVRSLPAKRIDFSRELIASLFFVYALAVVQVTFFPMYVVLYAFDPYDANLVPLVGILRMLQYPSPLALVNLVGNLALLAPLGIFLPVLLPQVRRAGQVLAIGFLVSLGIEIFQLVLMIRIFDVDDLLLNSLGVLLGYAVFVLFYRAPLISRLVTRFAGSPRPGWMRAFGAYTGLVLLAFLSFYAFRIVQQTETESTLLSELPARQRHLLGRADFDGFLFVFSQAEGGNRVVELYRRVFFNRYTLFQWDDDLQLEEGMFAVSGMSTGRWMNYFVVARSQAEVAAMVSSGASFPVVGIGEYFFAYARFPLQFDRFFSFRFVDARGRDMGLVQEQ